MSKFAGKLKDVDYSQPESYEADSGNITTGIVQGEVVVERPSEDISTAGHSVAEAFTTFAQKGTHRVEQSYDVYSKDTVTKGVKHEIQETLYQKYYRLREEVKELVHDVEANAAKSPSSSVPAVGDVSSLDNQLDSLADSKDTRPLVDGDYALLQAKGAQSAVIDRLGQLIDGLGNKDGDGSTRSASTTTQGKDPVVPKLTYELYLDSKTRSDVNGGAVSQRCAELNKRVSALEELLGPQLGADSQAVLERTLCEEVAHLSKRLHDLTPDAIHTVSMRAATATAQLKALQAEKKKAKEAPAATTSSSSRAASAQPSTATSATAAGQTSSDADAPEDEDTAKLHRLFKLMEQWDAAAASLPLVIERLQALKGLHEEAARFTQTIRSIEAEQNAITTLLSDHQEAYGHLEHALSDNMSTVKENISALYDRLASLEKS